MSKVDAQRAMREARWAALQKGRSAPSAPASPGSSATPGNPATSGSPANPATAKTRPKKTAVPVADDGSGAAVNPTAEPSESAESAESAKSLTSPEESEAPESAQLCGHRSIGNKSCTRPAGHPEKNHRYK